MSFLKQITINKTVINFPVHLRRGAVGLRVVLLLTNLYRLTNTVSKFIDVLSKLYKYVLNILIIYRVHGNSVLLVSYPCRTRIDKLIYSKK